MYLLAQTSDVTTGIDPLALNLASITAVVVTATLIVQRIFKPLAAKFPNTIGQVPTQIYLVLIASALTYVANKFLLTLPGDNVWRLIRDTVVAVFASPGLYTMPESWAPILQTKSGGIMLKKDDTPSVEQTASSSSSSSSSHPFMRVLLVFLLLPLFALSGCAATTPAFYQGIKSQWPAVRDTYTNYVNNDPKLLPADRSVYLDSAKNIDRLIDLEGRRWVPATRPSTN